MAKDIANKKERKMLEIIYKVLEINGDYALCESDKGNTTNIALALLPYDIDEGDKIRFCDFMYEKMD